MIIFVEYRVPVLVEIDADAGTIMSVRVDDESIEGPVGIVSESEISSDERSRAMAVAEADLWPAWKFGL